MNSDSTHRGKWSSLEDDQLAEAIAKTGEGKWQQVSLLVPGRTPIQCLHRWTKHLKPGLVRGPWTPQEDELLRQWAETQKGAMRWAECSARIPGRSGKQCRERWMNSLCPDIKRGDWTPSEDAVILESYKQFGPKWTLIASFLPGRPDNSIKNRFYAHLRKYCRNKSQKTDASEIVVDTDGIALLQSLQGIESFLKSLKANMSGMDSELERLAADKEA